MALASACQTDGAVYGTEIEPRAVAVRVDLPFALDLDPDETELLVTNLHNALELVLAPLWKRSR